MCSVLDNPKALKNWNFDKNTRSPNGREVAGGGGGGKRGERGLTTVI